MQAIKTKPTRPGRPTRRRCGGGYGTRCRRVIPGPMAPKRWSGTAKLVRGGLETFPSLRLASSLGAPGANASQAQVVRAFDGDVIRRH